MGRSLEQSSGNRRPWRKGRLLLLLILLLGLIALGGYTYLTRPQRLIRLANDLLGSMTGADVAVAHVQLDLDGMIRLRDVTLRVPGIEGDAGRLFEVDQIDIQNDLTDLVRGRFKPHSLTLLRPTLHLTRIIAEGKFNYQYLSTDDNKQRPLPAHVPTIEVRAGRIDFAELDGPSFLPLGQLRLFGKLTADPDRFEHYLFALTQELVDGSTGPTLSGTFDLRNLTIDAKLKHFILDRQESGVLSGRLSQWWQRLDPVGEVPAVQFGYDSVVGLHALFDVHDVELNPFPNLDARMRVATGQFAVTNKLIRITGLTGWIEGFAYTIDGEVRGFSKDAPFALQIDISGNLPKLGDAASSPNATAQPPPGLRGQVLRTLNQFDLIGRFEAHVNLTRPTAGGKIDYQGRLVIMDGKMRYARFAYPLDDVQAQFEFDDQTLRVVAVTGQSSSGAQVTATGSYLRPGPEARINLTVDARHVPLDDELNQALNQPQRNVLEALMDVTAYKRLTQESDGVIASSLQHKQWQRRLSQYQEQQRQLEADADVDAQLLESFRQQIVVLQQRLSRPEFDLGGLLSSTSKIHRPGGPDQKFTTTTRVDLTGVNVLLRHWPYPLTVLSGTVELSREHVLLEDLKFQGLSGVTGSINGGYYRDSTGSHRLSPRIDFSFDSMPIDDLLLASMPKSTFDTVRMYGLEGALDGTGRLLRRADGQIDFDIRASMQGGGARPYGGAYLISDLSTTFRFSRTAFEIESANATRAQSKLALSGTIAYGLGHSIVDLKINMQQMDLADPILDLVHPQMSGRPRLEALFAEYQPQGLFDAELTYHRTTGDESGDEFGDESGGKSGGDFLLALYPQQLNLLVHDQRIDLQQMTGTATVTPTGITLDAWQAIHSEGTVAVDGSITLDAQPTVALNFDIAGKLQSPVSAALLPAELAATLAAQGAAGKFTIRDGRLNIGPDASGIRQSQLRCAIELQDASVDVGLALTEINGLLQVQSNRSAKDQDAHLELHFEGGSLRAEDRLISPMKVRAATDETGQYLVIKPNGLIGACYGGNAIADGRVQLRGDRRYQFTMTLQQVALERLLHPRRRPSARRDDAPIAKLAAQLSLEALPGKQATRSGRGRITISDTRIYDLPLIQTMLHLVNISLPKSTAFDHADADFAVRGDLIQFDALVVRSPSLQLGGTGSMGWQSKELDLKMLIQNPDALDLGPLSDLFKGVKDELIQIHVGGTFDKPDAQLRTFQGIKSTWQQIMQPFQNKSQPVKPSKLLVGPTDSNGRDRR